MFKNTKKEDQQIPKKFQEILSVEEAKELRDRKFRDIPDYGESKEQIFKAINQYVNSEFSFPIYLYDKKGDHVFSVHSHAQAEAEEKGYVFERDSRGCISIDIKGETFSRQIHEEFFVDFFTLVLYLFWQKFIKCKLYNKTSQKFSSKSEQIRLVFCCNYAVSVV